MDDEFMRDVFDSVYGLKLPGFAVPGVDDLFEIRYFDGADGD